MTRDLVARNKFIADEDIERGEVVAWWMSGDTGRVRRADEASRSHAMGFARAFESFSRGDELELRIGGGARGFYRKLTVT